MTALGDRLNIMLLDSLQPVSTILYNLQCHYKLFRNPHFKVKTFPEAFQEILIFQNFPKPVKRLSHTPQQSAIVRLLVGLPMAYGWSELTRFALKYLKYGTLH